MARLVLRRYRMPPLVAAIVTTGVLAGTVVDPEGAPVSGASVEVWRWNDEGNAMVATGQTDGSGRFALSGLEPRSHDVVVKAEGYAPRCEALVPSADAGPTIWLEKGLPLDGRIVDAATSKPVAGARVEAGSEWHVLGHQGMAAVATATSDAEGNFHFPALEAGGIVIGVTAPGHGRVAQDVSIPTLSPELILLPPGRILDVRVADVAGAPVAGAVVMASCASDGSESGEDVEGRTGRDGRAILSSAPGCATLSLSVQHPQFVWAARTAFKPAGPLGGTSLVRMGLDHGISIAGRVLGGDGRPLLGAVVTVSGHSPMRRIETDASGSFRLGGLETGVHSLSVAHVGLGEHVEQMVDVQPPGVEGIEIQLLTGSRAVLFHVMDAAGMPIASARVASSQGNHHVNGHTDGAGTVQLHGFGEGPVALGVTAEGYLDTSKLEEEGNEVWVELERGGDLRGRVTDALTGEPVAMASLELFHVVEKGGIERPFERYGRGLTSSDARGTFEMRGLPQGTCTLEVDADGYERLAVPRIEVIPGAAPVVVALRRGRSLSGVVLDRRTGLSVAGADVTAREERSDTDTLGWNTQSGWGGSAPRRTARTDAEGRFRITGLDADYVSVWATRAGYAMREVHGLRLADHAGERGLVLEMGPGGLVQGRVSRDGQPLGGVAVHLPGIKVETGEDGTFSAEHVAPGRTMLVCEKEGNGQESKPMAIWREVRVVDGSPTLVDIEMATSVRVHGHLTCGGVPTAASLHVASGPGCCNWPCDVEPDGRYSFDAAPGPLVLDADSGYSRVRMEPVVPDVLDHEMDLELQGAVVELRVADDNGAEMEGVSAMLVPGASNWFDDSPTVSDDGVRTWSGLPEGTYEVAAMADGRAPAHQRVCVRRGETARVDLMLAPEDRRVAVTGNVIRPDGRPAFRASVALVVGGYLLGQAETDAEGRFSFHDVVPGGYELVASLAGVGVGVLTG